MDFFATLQLPNKNIESTKDIPIHRHKTGYSC